LVPNTSRARLDSEAEAKFAHEKTNQSEREELMARILAAQAHDEEAIQSLLEQFRPLLRSRMHRLWPLVRMGLMSLEWADVEAQITMLFLLRLRAFRPADGVYFAHYIEQMLDYDGRTWIRTLQRGAAMPFSQLSPVEDDGEERDDPHEWLLEDFSPDHSPSRDLAMALRDALDALPDPQRKVVWGCCVLGRTEADVALEMGLSRSAVRNRLEVALKQMRAHFQSDDENMEGEAGSTQGKFTRTGRASHKTPIDGGVREEFWNLILMAKDEKRPDLVGVGAGRPVLLQGVFAFKGEGLSHPQLLSPKLRYTVPPNTALGVRYLRVGSVCDQMVVVSTVVNGLTHRLVPCAANGTINVPFAIVDPIVAGSEIEIHLACEGNGTAIIDVGCLQMPA